MHHVYGTATFMGFPRGAGKGFDHWIGVVITKPYFKDITQQENEGIFSGNAVNPVGKSGQGFGGFLA